MSGLLQKSPANDPIYQFLDKKRSEGKPYYVYMTVEANEFLRRYYAKVMKYLDALEAESASESQQSSADGGGFATFSLPPARLTQAIKDAAGVARRVNLDGVG